MKAIKYSDLELFSVQGTSAWIGSFLVGIFGVISISASPAFAEKIETFTGAEVLEWSKAGQDSYFQTSITMAVFIAVQNTGNIGTCLNDWYFGTAGSKAQRNDEIRATMEKFAEYHPTSTILAVIEKACGSFTFAK